MSLIVLCNELKKPKQDGQVSGVNTRWRNWCSQWGYGFKGDTQTNETTGKANANAHDQLNHCSFELFTRMKMHSRKILPHYVLPQIHYFFVATIKHSFKRVI